MKVLHINTYQQWGAALCARRINKALVQAGENSRMLFAVGQNSSGDKGWNIARKDDCWWLRIPVLRSLIWRFIHYMPFMMDAEKLQSQVDSANSNHLYLHIPLSQYKNLAHHPLIKWADVIHLHWVSGFVDYPTFFKEVRKPIVWTLHDKYPAVGLQHYNSDFYPIPENLKALDEYCRQVKRKSLLKADNLHLVAISQMMLKVCRDSDVLCGFPVTLIHNGIDVSRFKLYDKQKGRIEIGLLPDAKIFLFSAYEIHDPNKGLNRVVNALEKIDIPNKMLVCIGMSTKPTPDATFPIILTGLLNNQDKISKYYSSADYFIQGSLEETFSQTPLESMACGTPVVSFPCSGANDLINENNGVVCEDFTVDALVNGIKTAMSREYHPKTIREDVIHRFSYDKIAQQYIELYKKVLEK